MANLTLLVDKSDAAKIRNTRISWNILLSLLIRLSGIAANLLLLRLLYRKLGDEGYGIWVTLFSVASYCSFIDFGVAHGLRNKLCTALSSNDIVLAKRLISSAFVFLNITILSAAIVLGVVVNFIPWDWILNLPLSVANNVNVASNLILLALLANLSFGIINSIFGAIQWNSLSGILPLAGNLIFICGLNFTTRDFAISDAALLYLVSILLAGLGTNLIAYSVLRELTPSIRLASTTVFRSVISLGIRFFAIQLSTLIVLTTDRIIVTHCYGPSVTSSFDICLRVLMFVHLLHAIIVSQYWSSFGDAFSRSDALWMSRNLRRVMVLTIPFLIGVFLAAGIIGELAGLLVGTEISIPTHTALVLAAFVSLLMWNATFAYCLNGMGKLNAELMTTGVGALLNVPLSLLFGVYFNLGPTGVVLGTIVVLVPFAIVGPMVAHRTVKGSLVQCHQ